MRSRWPTGYARTLIRTAAAAVLGVAAAWAGAQPAPWRGLRLQDQTGKTVAPAALDGQTVLLNFVFTGCSATCPVQTLELARLRRSLPPALRAKVDFLSVSVDPLADTPAALTAFAQRMGADQPGWRFLTGAPAQVDALVQRLAATDPRKKAPAPADHGTALYLFDTNGVLVQRYAGVPVDGARLARELGEVAQTTGVATPSEHTKTAGMQR